MLKSQTYLKSIKITWISLKHWTTFKTAIPCPSSFLLFPWQRCHQFSQCSWPMGSALSLRPGGQVWGPFFRDAQWLEWRRASFGSALEGTLAMQKLCRCFPERFRLFPRLQSDQRAQGRYTAAPWRGRGTAMEKPPYTSLPSTPDQNVLLESAGRCMKRRSHCPWRDSPVSGAVSNRGRSLVFLGLFQAPRSVRGIRGQAGGFKLPY